MPAPRGSNVRGARGCKGSGVRLVSEEQADVFDLTEYFSDVAEDVFIAKVKNANAEDSESLVSFEIVKCGCLARVHAAIDFHGQANLGAVEIDDQTADSMLPAKLERH